MNRTSINGSALVLSVAMATAWPLSPAVADKSGTPHENGVHPIFRLAALRTAHFHRTASRSSTKRRIPAST